LKRRCIQEEREDSIRQAEAERELLQGRVSALLAEKEIEREKQKQREWERDEIQKILGETIKTLESKVVKLEPFEEETEELRRSIAGVENSNRAFRHERTSLINERDLALEKYALLCQRLLLIQQEADKSKVQIQRAMVVSREKNQRIAKLEQEISDRQVNLQRLTRMVKDRNDELDQCTANCRGLQDQMMQAIAAVGEDERRLKEKLGKFEDLQGEVKRLGDMNKEKDKIIRSLGKDIHTRTEERDLARGQYEFVQQEFLQLQETRGCLQPVVKMEQEEGAEQEEGGKS
jgi:DNA repair exonuclease SbcCD ATPase subunit